MPQVASVRLRYASQDYWFDPTDIEVHGGDHVLVETSKGEEIGLCTQEVADVDEAEITKPLKPVLRVATEEDLVRADEIAARAQEALGDFRELAQKHELDMSPTAVEFSFDESHATFYFTSDDRVDFRSLVRDLAARFHVRVDMRQVGPRDEARMLGGLGHCGEELCCARLGGEFQPVSIRMAKEQDLPLNPTKISGLCGRLMCCLRYEFEAYKDFKSRAPKKNALIDTPAGMGKVVEFDTPRETVRLRMEDGSSLTLPVSRLDTGDKVPREGERIRPCHISQANFDAVMEELSKDSNLAMMGEKLFSDDPDLADATARAGSIERVQRRKRESGGSSSHRQQSDSGRKPRRRSSAAPAPQPRDERKKRRSVSATDGTEIKHDDTPRERASSSQGGQESSNANRSRSRRRRSNGKPRQDAPKRSEQNGGSRASSSRGSASSRGNRPRPGQHSSTVSGDAAKASGSNGNGSGNRRRRHRRSNGGNGSGSGKAGSDAGRE